MTRGTAEERGIGRRRHEGSSKLARGFWPVSDWQVPHSRGDELAFGRLKRQTMTTKVVLDNREDPGHGLDWGLHNPLVDVHRHAAAR